MKLEEKGVGEDDSEDQRTNEVEEIEETYSLTRYSQKGGTLCTRRIGRNPPSSIVYITLEGNTMPRTFYSDYLTCYQ